MGESKLPNLLLVVLKIFQVILKIFNRSKEGLWVGLEPVTKMIFVLFEGERL
jgi:hypothetical protein